MKKNLFIFAFALLFCNVKNIYGQGDPCHLPSVLETTPSVYGDSAYATIIVTQDPLVTHTFVYKLYKGLSQVGPNLHSVNDTIKIPELDTNTTYVLKAINTCSVEIILLDFTTPDASFNQEFDIEGRFDLDPCQSPQVISTSVAFYGTKAWGHIEIDTPTVQNFTFSLYLSGSQVGSSFQATDGHIVLPDLSQNSLYTVKVNNSCSTLIDFESINTTMEWDTGSLMLSKKMFTHITNWASDTAQDSSWYDYIVAIPDVHVIEKVSAMQRWWHHDSLPISLTTANHPALPEFMPNSETISPYTPGGATTASATCTCTYIISVGEEVLSNIKNDPNDPSGGLKTLIVNNANDKQGNIKAAIWNNDANSGWGKSNAYQRKGWTRAGATKYMQLMAQRFQDENELIWEEGLGNGGGATSSYSKQLRIGYVCVNQQLPNWDCCDRTINMQWDYSTNVEASSQTNRCVGCSKYAASSTEDFAVVSVLDVKSNNIEIKGAGRVLVKSESTISYNPAFGIAVVDIAAKIALAINEVNNGIDPVKMINSCSTALHALVTIPSTTKGSASDHHFSGALTNGAVDITLKANEPKVIMLSSHSRQLVKGKRAWWANSRIESGSYISIRHNGGINNNADYCCGPVVGSWVIVGNPNAPVTSTAYKTMVKNHMNDWPDWGQAPNYTLSSINFDFGRKVGVFNPTCSTAVAIGRTTQNPNNGEKLDPTAKVFDNGIFIEYEPETKNNIEICKYELYDVTGHLINKGELNKSEMIWFFNDAVGIYFIKTNVNGVIKTQKIAVIK